VIIAHIMSYYDRFSTYEMLSLLHTALFFFFFGPSQCQMSNVLETKPEENVMSRRPQKVRAIRAAPWVNMKPDGEELPSGIYLRRVFCVVEQRIILVSVPSGRGQRLRASVRTTHVILIPSHYVCMSLQQAKTHGPQPCVFSRDVTPTGAAACGWLVRNGPKPCEMGRAGSGRTENERPCNEVGGEGGADAAERNTLSIIRHLTTGWTYRQGVWVQSAENGRGQCLIVSRNLGVTQVEWGGKSRLVLVSESGLDICIGAGGRTLF
jgi:hypothetical protein